MIRVDTGHWKQVGRGCWSLLFPGDGSPIPLPAAQAKGLCGAARSGPTLLDVVLGHQHARVSKGESPSLHSRKRGCQAAHPPHTLENEGVHIAELDIRQSCLSRDGFQGLGHRVALRDRQLFGGGQLETERAPLSWV